MKKYRFKKVLLVIACFSLVIVMTACGSGGSGGGSSHASISTDLDNPSELTFPETAEDGTTFYQSIYNSTVDDPDAEPGTIYGCYQGTLTDGDTMTFVVSKPQLPDAIARKIDENGLKYLVISTMRGDIEYTNARSTLYIFKNDASCDAISRDQKTVEVYGKCIDISLGTEDDYMEAGGGRIESDFTTFNEHLEDYVLENIDQIIEH